MNVIADRKSKFWPLIRGYKTFFALNSTEHYTIIDLCLGGRGVLLSSKRHIDRRGAEVNMIKFTVQ